MLGIIVTGHGEFSHGMESAIKLIVGEVSNLKCINFLEGASSDDLFIDLKMAIEELNLCKKIVIFCDLAGGSPYKSAIHCSLIYEQVRVVAGTNFPTLLEFILSQDNDEEMDAALSKSIQTGKNQLFIFDKEALNI